MKNVINILFEKVPLKKYGIEKDFFYKSIIVLCCVFYMFWILFSVNIQLLLLHFQTTSFNLLLVLGLLFFISMLFYDIPKRNIRDFVIKSSHSINIKIRLLYIVEGFLPITIFILMHLIFLPIYVTQVFINTDDIILFLTNFFILTFVCLIFVINLNVLGFYSYLKAQSSNYSNYKLILLVTTLMILLFFGDSIVANLILLYSSIKESGITSFFSNLILSLNLTRIIFNPIFPFFTIIVFFTSIYLYFKLHKFMLSEVRLKKETTISIDKKNHWYFINTKRRTGYIEVEHIIFIITVTLFLSLLNHFQFNIIEIPITIISAIFTLLIFNRKLFVNEMLFLFQSKIKFRKSFISIITIPLFNFIYVYLCLLLVSSMTFNLNHFFIAILLIMFTVGTLIVMCQQFISSNHLSVLSIFLKAMIISYGAITILIIRVI